MSSLVNDEHEPSGIAVDGAEIRRRRKLRGEFIAAVAERAGISDRYLSHIELGRRKTVSPPVFARLCDELGVVDRKELMAGRGAAA